jgi:hypothetical protein
MTNKISIGLGLANLPEGVDTEEIERFIASGGKGYDTYTLAPAPPGAIRAAALEIMVILSAAGSVASIAALLWMAYDKFIAPKKSRDQDDGGIYIAIRRPDGTLVDFWIGNTHRDRQIFIKQFTTKVSSIQKEDDPEFWTASVADVEKSGDWVRIRKR